jgi:predicted HTH domain antitoxin
MASLVLEIPADLAEALRLPPDEQAERLRQELAIRLYQKEILSIGKARKLAGLSKWDFHERLGQEGIPHHYGHEELQQDLDTLETLD